MPVITVLQGPRDADARRALVAGLTDAMVEAYSIPPEAVQVWIQEVPVDSWGEGGTLRADT